MYLSIYRQYLSLYLQLHCIYLSAQTVSIYLHTVSSYLQTVSIYQQTVSIYLLTISMYHSRVRSLRVVYFTFTVKFVTRNYKQLDIGKTSFGILGYIQSYRIYVRKSQEIQFLGEKNLEITTKVKKSQFS